MKRHAYLIIFCLTILMLLTAIPITAEVVYIKDVGMTGVHGPYPLTEIRNNTLFGGSDRGIDIYDISNPQQRILLYSIPTLGKLQHFTVYNYILALADSTQGILIYDVSDPALPVLLSSIPDQRACIKLVIHRDKLFAGSAQEMAIYSLNDLAQPRELKKLTLITAELPHFGMEDFIVDDEHIIMGGSKNTPGTMIYDIRDINAIQITFSNYQAASAFDKRNFQFQSIWTEGLTLFTPFSMANYYTTNPSALDYGTQMNTYIPLYRLKIDLRHLLVQANNNLVDYNMIQNPILVNNGNHPTSDSVIAVETARNRVYSAVKNSGHGYLLIQKPGPLRASMERLDSLNLIGNILDLDCHDSLMVVLLSDSVMVFDIRSDQLLQVNGWRITDSSVTQIHLYDRMLFLAGPGGLKSYDMSSVFSGTAPVPISLSGSHVPAVFADNYFLAYQELSGLNRLLMFRKSGSGYENTPYASYNIADTVRSIALTPKHAFIAMGDKGIQSLNISTPHSITLIDTLTTTSAAPFTKVTCKDDILAILAGPGGLITYFDYDVNFVKPLGTYQRGNDCFFDVVQDFNFFYVGIDTLGLQILRLASTNYSDQKNTFGLNLAAADSLTSFCVDDDRLYSFTQTDSMSVYDLKSNSPLYLINVIPEYLNKGGTDWGPFNHIVSYDTLAFTYSYTLYHRSKFNCFSIKDSVNGRFLSTLTFQDSLGGAATYQNRYIYLGVGSEIKIYDYLNPSLPLAMPAQSVPGTITSMTINGNRLYLVAGSTIRMYDLSDPLTPLELNSMELSFHPIKLIAMDTIIYVLDALHYVDRIGLAGNGFADQSNLISSRVIDIAADQDYLYYQAEADLNIYAVARQGGLTTMLIPSSGRTYSLDAFGNQLLTVLDGELGHRIYARNDNQVDLIYSSDAYNANRVSTFNHERNKLLISEGNAIRILDVDLGNHAPHFTHTVPDTTIMATRTLRIDLAAEDQDGDPVSFELMTTTVPNATLNGNQFVFTPSDDQVGIINFIIRVTDGRNGVTDDTAIIEVKPYQAPPQAFNLLSPIPGQTLASIPIDFSWQRSVNAGLYDFYCGSDTNLITPVANLTDTLYQLNGVSFPENGTLYWKVVAKLADQTAQLVNTGGFQKFYYSAVNEAPSDPVIVHPVNSERVPSLRPDFTFLKSVSVDPEDTSLHYYIEISGTRTFSALLYKDSLIDPPSSLDTLHVASQTDCVENYPYYWRVRSLDQGGLYSGWDSDSFYVDAQNDPPTPFDLIAPAHQTRITADSVRLRWRTASDLNQDSVFYRVQIDTFNSFVQFLVDTVITDTSYLFSGAKVKDNTVFYWRIIAQDKLGAARTSNQANYYFWRDANNQAPGVAVPYSPVLGAVLDTLKPTLIIENSKDPDPFDGVSYRFQLFSNEACTQLIEQSEFLSGGLSGRTSYSVTTTLTNNTTYYWKVLVTDGDLTVGQEVSFFFTINQSNRPPQTPVLKSPAHQSVTETGEMNFRWSRSSDPDGDLVYYRLRVGYNNSLTLPVAKDTILRTDTTCTVTVPFTDDLDYWWSVWASDGKDSVSAASAWKFTCSINQQAPSAPTPQQPALSQLITQARPTFTVTNSTDPNVGDQIRYYFEIDTTFAFNSAPPVKITSGYISQGSGSTTSYTVDVDLLDNYAYYWRCKAYDQLDNSSPFSKTILFYVDHTPQSPTAFQLWYPQRAQIMTPADSFLWQSSSDPDLLDTLHYILSIYRDSLRTSLVYQINTARIPHHRFDYSGVLKDDSLYFWQVKAVDKTARTTSSEIRRFIYSLDGQTGLNPFNLIYPANQASDVELKPTFRWNRSYKISAPGDVLIYCLTLMDNSAVPPETRTVFPITDTLWSIDDSLKFGHSYLWRVGAIDPLNMSDTTWSPYGVFTALSRPAGGLIAFDYYIDNGCWVFAWQENPVIPFHHVSIYSDNGTGIMDYSQPVRDVVIPECTTRVEFWQSGTLRHFEIQSYNASGDPSSANPIHLKLVPDSSVPQIICPNPSMRVDSNHLAFVMRSPIRDFKSGSYSMRMACNETNPAFTLIPSISQLPHLSVVTLIDAFSQLYSQNQFWLTGRNSTAQLENQILFYYGADQSGLSQKMSGTNPYQQTILKMNRGQDARFAACPSSQSDYYYQIQTPVCWLDNVSLSTEFLSLSQNSGQNSVVQEALLINSTSWESFQDSLIIRMSSDLWTGSAQIPPYLFKFKKSGTSIYNSIPTDYDPIDRCLICRIKDNGELILTHLSDINDSESPTLKSEITLVAYPNPFNQRVTLSCNGGTDISRIDKEFRIYNIDGQLIWESITSQNQVIWDGKKQGSNHSVASGLYFYQVKAGDRILKGKMVLLK